MTSDISLAKADTLPDIWRLALRSGRSDMSNRHTEQVEYCLANHVGALGWQTSNDGTVGDALRRIAQSYPGAARHTVQRFIEAPAGCLVWTLHTDGTYRIGELTGPWRYDGTGGAADLDCFQVRPVLWADQELDASDVPGGVIRQFSGRGSSFSRIHDKATRLYSHRLFDMLLGRPARVPRATAEETLFSLLDPWDVEDLVAVFLQIQGFLILPASRQTSTPGYEFVLIDSKTGQHAIVQIKTGNTAVDVGLLASAAGSDRKAFAFSTRGRYDGESPRVTRIASDDLLEFMNKQRRMLPPRVQRWLDR